MPDAVERQAVKVGNVVPFIGQLVLLVCIWGLARHSAIPASMMGITSSRWQMATVAGVLVGLAWIGIYAWVLLAFRHPINRVARHRLLERPTGFWVPLGFLAAFIEEVWRAFCLVAFAGSGYFGGLAVTTIAAGLAHPQPLARAMSAMLFNLSASALFLSTRSLLAPISTHAIVNVVTPYLVRFAYRSAAEPN